MKKYIKLTIMITAVIMLSLPINMINIVARDIAEHSIENRITKSSTIDIREVWQEQMQFDELWGSPGFHEQISDMLNELMNYLDLPRRPDTDWGMAPTENGLSMDFNLTIFKSCLSYEEIYLVAEWAVKIATTLGISKVALTIPLINDLDLAETREVIFLTVDDIDILPFFDEYVFMIIESFDENKVILNIINESGHEVYFWHNRQCWSYSNAYSIKIDYFDGENWRNITHNSIESNIVHFISPSHFFDPAYRLLISPYDTSHLPRHAILGIRDSIVIEHCTHWHNLPIDEYQLFRIRKHINSENLYLHSLDFFKTNHTLTAEFYWDGYEFRAVEQSPPPPPIQMPLVPSVPSLPSN